MVTVTEESMRIRFIEYGSWTELAVGQLRLLEIRTVCLCGISLRIQSSIEFLACVVSDTLLFVAVRDLTKIVYSDDTKHIRVIEFGT
jgi:hypothetical protein